MVAKLVEIIGFAFVVTAAFLVHVRLGFLILGLLMIASGPLLFDSSSSDAPPRMNE